MNLRDLRPRTLDEWLHVAGNIALSAVGAAADIATPGVWVVWGMFAVGLVLWPGREWAQHSAKGRPRNQLPWSEGKRREAWLPVAWALPIPVGMTIVEALFF